LHCTGDLIIYMCFFFSHTDTHGLSTLSLHDALPISRAAPASAPGAPAAAPAAAPPAPGGRRPAPWPAPPPRPSPVPPGTDAVVRSEEHTSELQSRGHLVCRLLLEKKKRTAAIGMSTN